jgi:hypothetical protein
MLQVRSLTGYLLRAKLNIIRNIHIYLSYGNHYQKKLGLKRFRAMELDVCKKHTAFYLSIAAIQDKLKQQKIRTAVKRLKDYNTIKLIKHLHDYLMKI